MSIINESLSPVNLFDHIESRVLSGSPFSDARSAVLGSELITVFGTIAVHFIIFQQTLHIRASNPRGLWSTVAVADRLGRGQYQLLMDRTQFNTWFTETTALVIEEEELSLSKLPAPVHPADAIAEELKAQYGQHKRFVDDLAKAVELVKIGMTEFDEYGTGVQFAKNPPTRICGCPHAQFRTFWLDKIGMCCKHTLAQLIKDLIDQQANQVKQRRVMDNQDKARRLREQALPAYAIQTGSILEALG